MSHLEVVNLKQFHKALLIFNRNSGKQLFASMASKVKGTMMKLNAKYPNLDLELLPLHRFDEIPAAADYARDCAADWVIIAGGDGTIRAVVEQLRKRSLDPYISVFPGGTVNLIAKELALVNDPVRWVRRVGKGRVESMYLGEANGSLFLTVAGIGFDSLVVHGVTMLEKKLLSKLAYVVEGTEMMRRELLFSHWRYQFAVRLDGGEWRDATSVIVGKSRYYAGHYNLFRDASLALPEFRVALFRGKTRVDFLRYASLIGMESLALDKDIDLLPAKKVEIRLVAGNDDLPDGEFPVELDGDSVTATPVTITMQPQPLKLLV